MHRFGWWCLVGALGFSQTPGQGLPQGVTPEMVEKGKVLYQGNGLCAACHGQQGQGGIGPDLRDSVWALGRGTFPELVERITRGVPADSSAGGSVMPPLGGSSLSPAEVRMVAAFVWTLSHPGTQP